MNPRELLWYGAILCALLAGAYLVAGLGGTFGALLGLATGLFGAMSLHMTVRALRGSQPRAGIIFTVLMFVAKFPVLGLGGYVAFQQGMEGLLAFVIGALVVYSALVWRAVRYDLYPQ